MANVDKATFLTWFLNAWALKNLIDTIRIRSIYLLACHACMQAVRRVRAVSSVG